MQIRQLNLVQGLVQ